MSNEIPHSSAGGDHPDRRDRRADERAAVAAALQTTPEPRFDGNLGAGVAFRCGPQPQTSLELYAGVVRVTLPVAEIVVPRREAEAETGSEGVVFRDGDRFRLSLGPAGDVVFRYAANAAGAAAPTDEGPPPTAPPAEKVESERYVGRLGEVRTHRTKQGKLVAEVELTVADPDRPGASRLVKFVAFGEKAAALAREYRPGQEVTAVGIPHELQRRGRDGREWTERQLYLVQLPKAR